MTASLDIWINDQRPEDVLARAIEARLNVGTMTAADRRTAMDQLIRHVVVDPAQPAAGECGWCPTRRRLASMSDGASHMPEFGRLVASPGHRVAIGRPCGSCIKAALGPIGRRVHKPQPQSTGGHKNFGGATRSTPNQPGGSAHHDYRVASSNTRNKHHDPFGTCSSCKNYLRIRPDVALTAGGMPQGCPPHAWNELPKVIPAWWWTA